MIYPTCLLLCTLLCLLILLDFDQVAIVLLHVILFTSSMYCLFAVVYVGFFMYVKKGDLILHLYDFYYASHFSILAQFIMCLALSVFSLVLYFGR